MKGKRFSLLALLLAVAILCGCVGYFHYHPVKSTEQERAKAAGESLFSSETMGAPGAPAVSAEPLTEEPLIIK